MQIRTRASAEKASIKVNEASIEVVEEIEIIEAIEAIEVLRKEMQDK